MICGTKRRPWTPIIEGDAARIPLTQGLFATVDLADLSSLSGNAWYAQKGPSGTFYAIGVFLGDGSRTMMHRAIMAPRPEEFVDHRNRDGLMNRRANLRVCTKSQNAQNMVGKSKSSPFKGVSLHRSSGLWGARIHVNGEKISLRYHKTDRQAALAYDEAAEKYFGEFALTNRKMGLL